MGLQRQERVIFKVTFRANPPAMAQKNVMPFVPYAQGARACLMSDRHHRGPLGNMGPAHPAKVTSTGCSPETPPRNRLPGRTGPTPAGVPVMIRSPGFNW